MNTPKCRSEVTHRKNEIVSLILSKFGNRIHHYVDGTYDDYHGTECIVINIHKTTIRIRISTRSELNEMWAYTTGGPMFGLPNIEVVMELLQDEVHRFGALGEQIL